MYNNTNKRQIKIEAIKLARRILESEINDRTAEK